MDKRSFLFIFLVTTSVLLINNYFFPYEAPSTQKEKAIEHVQESGDEAKVLAIANLYDKKDYYVLENERMQVVFSASDGSISEINLPFQSKTHPKSIVHTIDIDDKIEERYKNNASFPLQSYYIVENGSPVSKEPTKGGYTPLLRRSLLKEDGSFSYRMPAKFYATALLSSNLETAGLSPFRVTNFTKDSITLSSGSVSKTYTLLETPYTIKLSITNSDTANRFWLSTGFPEVELVSGAYAPLLQTYTTTGKRGKVAKIALPKSTGLYETAHPTWVSSSNGFFGMILDPLSPLHDGVMTEVVSGQDIPSRLTLIDAEYNIYPASNYPGYQIFLPSQGQEQTSSWHFYAGPFDTNLLKNVDKELSSAGENPYFSKATKIHGWFAFISEPFAKIMFVLMQFFYFITRSWGISLILIALALRIMLYPLNTWSYKSNLKAQKIGPKLTALQEKYKNDPNRQRMEMAMLYKTEKVNPLAGCLIFLIQIPFLLGVLDLLKTSFVLRGVSFIPGWIDDLTAPDALFCWTKPIFFLGSCFHLLPFILGALMYVQSKMGAKQQGQAPVNDQQAQMQKVGSIMTIAFTFFFYSMPSGLNIYWIFSTVFGILQQWLIMRQTTVRTRG